MKGLKLKASIWCVKEIGQSPPYPSNGRRHTFSIVVLFLYHWSGAEQTAGLCSSQLDAQLGGQSCLMPMAHKILKEKRKNDNTHRNLGNSSQVLGVLETMDLIESGIFQQKYNVKTILIFCPSKISEGFFFRAKLILQNLTFLKICREYKL